MYPAKKGFSSLEWWFDRSLNDDNITVYKKFMVHSAGEAGKHL